MSSLAALTVKMRLSRRPKLVLGRWGGGVGEADALEEEETAAVPPSSPSSFALEEDGWSSPPPFASEEDNDDGWSFTETTTEDISLSGDSIEIVEEEARTVRARAAAAAAAARASYVARAGAAKASYAAGADAARASYAAGASRASSAMLRARVDTLARVNTLANLRSRSAAVESDDPSPPHDPEDALAEDATGEDASASAALSPPSLPSLTLPSLKLSDAKASCAERAKASSAMFRARIGTFRRSNSSPPDAAEDYTSPLHESDAPDVPAEDALAPPLASSEEDASLEKKRPALSTFFEKKPPASSSECQSSDGEIAEGEEEPTAKVEALTSSAAGAFVRAMAMEAKDRAAAAASAKASVLRAQVDALRSRSPNADSTLLHRMCSKGVNSYSVKVISAYLEENPDEISAVDKRGMTPLHAALDSLPERDDVVAFLVDRAPEACEMRDLDGATPLHNAARNATAVSSETLKLLLMQDPTLALDEDLNGETPFGLYCAALEDAARRKRDAEFLKMVRSRHADDEQQQQDDEDAEDDESPVDYEAVLDKSVPIVRAIAWGDPRTKSEIEHDDKREDDDNSNDDDNEEDDDDRDEKRWEGMLHAALYAVERATSDTHTTNGSGKSENEVPPTHSRRYRLLVRAVMKRMYRWKDNEEASDEEQQQQQEGNGNGEQQQQQQQNGGEGNEESGEQQQQQQQQEQPQQQQQGQGDEDAVQQQPQEQGDDEENDEQQSRRERSNPASEVDSRGNLPLHVAAGIPFLNETTGGKLVPLPSSENDNDGHGKGARRHGIADELVRCHPEATSITNSSGLLSFDIAEKNGSGWADGGVRATVRADRAPIFGMELTEGAIPRMLSRVGTDLDLGAMFEVLKERPEMMLRASASGKQRR